MSGAQPSIARRLREAAIDDATAVRWRELTRLPEKAAYYELNPYFRLAWSDACHYHGSNAAAVFRNVGAVMFRPDAIAGRRIERCLAFLRDHGFAPVALLPIEISRHGLLELWRYQNNAATVDRLAATEELARSGSGLYLLLLDQTGGHRVPAAVRLRTLKGRGSGDPPASPPTLRSEADIVNRMLSMVHTADEPIDLVRELGIWFDAPVRHRLIRALASLRPLPDADVEAIVAEAYTQAPPVEFDPHAAAGRLSRALTRSPAAVEWAENVRCAQEEGQGLAWLALSRTLSTDGADVEQWDLTQVATHFITCDESEDMLILGNGESAWYSEHATTTSGRQRFQALAQPIRERP